MRLSVGQRNLKMKSLCVLKKKVSVGWRGISCNNCSMVFSHIDHAFSFQKEKKTMLFLFFFPFCQGAWDGGWVCRGGMMGPERCMALAETDQARYPTILECVVVLQRQHDGVGVYLIWDDRASMACYSYSTLQTNYFQCWITYMLI